MREIKFRAWDEISKRMSNIQELKFERRGDLIIHTKKFGGNVINFKLMQSTGLKDKNGKEIFEGDILEFGDTGRKEVVFWEGCFVYMINENKGHIFDPKSVEVIGNKFENPELLEDKK